MSDFKYFSDMQLIMFALAHDNKSEAIRLELLKRASETRVNISRKEWDEMTNGKPFVRTCSEVRNEIKETEG